MVEVAGVKVETYIGGPRPKGDKDPTKVFEDKDAQRIAESLAKLTEGKDKRLPVEV